MNLSMPVPSQGTATLSLGGSGSFPLTSDHISGASLSGSCSGSACVSPSVSGAFDLRFASGGNAAVANGGVLNAVKDSSAGAGIPRSILFLDLMKCTPGC
jgi:hypothetical protein